MKKYNIINNSLGWLCFIIAAVTYLLTLEPTASFWDCPEFISQGYKLEVGHPPGNPIFMLAARFFVNFAGGDVSKVAFAVNSMSALLSAGTILLLFWTITHLVKRLIVKDDETSVSLSKMLVIFGSGLVGALAYTWSDTFWFSAAEGEVYAFSSFCTALVFWLILKWENRAEQPHSDRYLILIAYVIGISIGVHLLNLLCIPAIVLVVYYRKFKNTNAKGSLIALGVSCVIVGLILYGLVPGFIEVAQYFELLTVNTFGWSYNSGTLLYAILAVVSFVWAIYELYNKRNENRIKLSILLSVLFSGIPFIGDNLLIPVLIIGGLGLYLFKICKKLPMRILSISITSIFVIFIGYSSYALLLIRSNANTPMNQNAPDNVFSLSSYLNREQYGERPLFYGQTFNSSVLYQADRNGNVTAMQDYGKTLYGKVVKSSPEDPDRYIVTGQKSSYKMLPELNMLFPRMYSTSPEHVKAYKNWIGMNNTNTKYVDASLYVDEDGNTIHAEKRIRPTFGQNMQFFLTYQLNHMYWRYFMWNFAGRQNDIQGNGEVNHGNWISGIPFIDNARLGDQSLLPDDLGKGNKGHNVFYMLPLILGIIGLLWQAFTSKRGIEQFWVVFFLFFMTGIAIVLYLNQTPGQPRERDYAFAGSFYAYAIWIGIGVAGLYSLIKDAIAKKANESKIAAATACVLGLAVPVQMVSQTWDDHDRSGRYTARDFGMNYLSSVDPNAIIFTYGDNDTFPLWYAQEVEGYRTDVRVVNLSYLTTDWYANQLRYPSYDAPAIDMLAQPADFGYDRLQFNYFLEPDTIKVPVSMALEALYSPESSKNRHGVPEFKYPNMYIPIDREAAIKSGRVTLGEADAIEDSIDIDLQADASTANDGGLSLSKVLSIDMLNTSIANGWNRPVYFAMTIPDSYYLGLAPYMRNTGLAYEISPIKGGDGENIPVNTEKMYDNVMTKFRWGGLDKVTDQNDIYLDETIRRMVTTHRSTLVDLATTLYNEGVNAEFLADDYEGQDTAQVSRLREFANSNYIKASNVLDLILEKLPVAASPFSVQIGENIADVYLRLGIATNDRKLTQKGLGLLENEIRRYAQYIRYYQALKPWQFATLQRTDHYIYSVYFMSLLRSYDIGGGDAEALLSELAELGIDFGQFMQN
ncbi:MAG: DUF2723 domain-containing protein [Muribaculaceae bacterium]|nr:DUF2723 domain-containing protein [Muribaculaceae bacterium]